EANAWPGVANRLLARRARVVCLGVDEAASRLGAGRAAGAGPTTVVTGNPVRGDLPARVAALPPAAARARFGLAPERKTLLVMGGSLGASRLNDWVLAERARFAAADTPQVLWQSGRAHHAACRARLGKDEASGASGAPGVHLVPFIDDMA